MVVARSAAFAVGLWICLSASLIIFNASLLRSFRHPIALITWHMLVSCAIILVIRIVRPSLVATGDVANGVPPLTISLALKLGTPVALAHAISMIFGNSAYLYLTVSFIQMIKAWTSACVYLVGCLMNTQSWSTPVAKTIFCITMGLMVASLGELEFNAKGFFLQLASILIEGVRINLLEISLKSKGYKLNPVSSLQIFAPLMLAFLLPCVALWDQDALSPGAIDSIGVSTFLANALMAFFLNISVYLVIQRASGLIFALGGVLKDILIIGSSAAFLSSPISATQVVGYLFALAGLHAYGIVSKSPADFEKGVLPELWRRLVSFSAENKYELPKHRPEGRDTSERLGALEDAMQVTFETRE